MLAVENLEISRGKNVILKNLNLTINKADLVVLFGKNGSGKSTFSSALAGSNELNITGEINFSSDFFYKINGFDNHTDLLKYPSYARSWLGLFSAVQNPPAIDGISLKNLIKTIVEINREARNQDKLTSKQLLTQLKSTLLELELSSDFLEKVVGLEMSGGEQKRSELLQAEMLEPRFCILDEIDSGLDLKGQDLVADFILKRRDRGVSFLVITHSLNFARRLKPDKYYQIENHTIVQTRQD